MKKKLLLVFSATLFCLISHAQIFINEVMSNNQSTKQDEDGDYSDWIEIYNAGPSSVNLLNYTLSDNPDSLQKWHFPSVNLAKDSFLIVWCDRKNRVASSTKLHSNFSLDSDGETIFLSNTSPSVIDNIPSSPLVEDKTYGRITDGNSTLAYLSAPTFKKTNNTTTSVTGLIPDAPLFSIPGGFYATQQSISLSHIDPTVTIRYTLDGSDPTINSPAYSSPITVQSRAGDPNVYSSIRTCYPHETYLPDWYPPLGQVYKCNVVRARAFKNGYFPGPIQTYTYFIDPNIQTRYGNLPIISVVSDPKNLFNDTTGIYVPGYLYNGTTWIGNYYKDWDRPANIEMYVPGGAEAFNGNFKISIGGASSPSSPQKTINVNASGDYGPKNVDYPLFQNRNGKAKYIQNFDKIKIRAWGSDRKKLLFHDALCNSFVENTDLDFEAYQPAIIFIDGEYWGIQEIRERDRNNEYYQDHYYIDADNPGCDILDGAGNTIIEGDHVHWDAMIAYINSNTLSNPANYNYVKTQMDVNSFMLNYVQSIYFARGDWPDQNEAKWRPRISGGKWKWIQWDMDNTASYYLNPWYDMFTLVLTGARGYGPSDLLDSLLASTEFKNNFINLFADWMNTEFLSTLAQGRVDKMAAELSPYMPEYMTRWQLNTTWSNQVDSTKWWLNLRPQYVKQHLNTHFALGGNKNVTLDVSDSLKGNIQVNTLFLDAKTARTTSYTYPWTGQYFVGCPVPLTAIAKPGYRFVEWLPSHDPNPSITLNLTVDVSLTAVFDIDPNYHASVLPMINEVMSSNLSTISDNYNEFDDWVEIYNPGNDTLELGGYYLTDNLVLPTRFYIIDGTDSSQIPPHGHMLIWIDDDTEQGMFHTSFKFNSNGDFIALIAPDGVTIVDSISFGALAQDVSYGRRHDGDPQYINFSPSTPHATNWTFSSEDLYINELQTSNVSTIQDNYGDHDSWVELYNPNNDTIDIAGWRITPDPVNDLGFRFLSGNDSTKIAPFGYKLIWVDNETIEGSLHLNFNLGASGCISLIKPNDDFVDSACYAGLNADESYGRISDGNVAWMNFQVPTPDSNNVDLTATFEHVFINELQTTNLSTVQDNYGQFDQWIELYNPNSDTVDVAGWKITNDPQNLTHYTFLTGNDSTKIAPNGFKLVWADNQTSQGVLHVNFTLQPSTCVSLYKPNDDFGDSVCYSNIGTDHSYGRLNDGNPLWMNYAIPTPDSNNVDLTIGIDKLDVAGNLVVYPNPLNGNKIYFNRSVSFRIYDSLGRQLADEKERFDFDMTSFERGIYLIRTDSGKTVKIIKQ